MNDWLYKHLLKQELKKIMGCSLGIALYEWVITWVYPILIESPSIKEIHNNFPSTVKKAFGIEEGEKIDLSYEAYISAQLLNRFWPLILSVYGISEAKSLLVQPIEQKTIVYALAAPIARKEFYITLICVCLTELMVLGGVQFAGIYSAAAFFAIKMEKWRYLKSAISAISLGIFISSYSFLLSVFNLNLEKGVNIIYIITLAFYGFNVGSNMSNKLSFLKYFTPFALYRPYEILQGKAEIRRAVFLLLFVSAIIHGWALRLFKNKDICV